MVSDAHRKGVHNAHRETPSHDRWDSKGWLTLHDRSTGSFVDPRLASAIERTGSFPNLNTTSH